MNKRCIVRIGFRFLAYYAVFQKPFLQDRNIGGPQLGRNE